MSLCVLFKCRWAYCRSIRLWSLCSWSHLHRREEIEWAVISYRLLESRYWCYLHHCHALCLRVWQRSRLHMFTIFIEFVFTNRCIMHGVSYPFVVCKFACPLRQWLISDVRVLVAPDHDHDSFFYGVEHNSKHKNNANWRHYFVSWFLMYIFSTWGST